MNQLFLLKLMSTLLELDDKTNVNTVRTILKEMIKENEVPIGRGGPLTPCPSDDMNLDPIAAKARQELLS